MKCPECEAAGEKSKLYESDCSMTAGFYPPFYDEDGARHDHDQNLEICNYRCSNGHRFAKHKPHKCWCGWTQGD